MPVVVFVRLDALRLCTYCYQHKIVLLNPQLTNVASVADELEKYIVVTFAYILCKHV